MCKIDEIIKAAISSCQKGGHSNSDIQKGLVAGANSLASPVSRAEETIMDVLRYREAKPGWATAWQNGTGGFLLDCMQHGWMEVPDGLKQISNGIEALAARGAFDKKSGALVLTEAGYTMIHQ